jgi:hypothetical protein
VKLSKIRKQLKLNRQRQLDLFHIKQNVLREKWSYISSNRRVIVHIPSLGLTKRIRKKLNNLSLRENYQIGRICELEDPNIDVIYVSPMPVNDEIIQYYNKLVRYIFRRAESIKRIKYKLIISCETRSKTTVEV